MQELVTLTLDDRVFGRGGDAAIEQAGHRLRRDGVATRPADGEVPSDAMEPCAGVERRASRIDLRGETEEALADQVLGRRWIAGQAGEPAAQ